MTTLRIAAILLAANASLAQAQSADPIVYFSLSESLASLTPLEGAEVPPALVWFKVEPGLTWENRGVRSIRSWCCKDISNGDPHGPVQTVSEPGPYVYQRNLIGAKEGSAREFYMDAFFANNPYESDTTNFRIKETGEDYVLTSEDCNLRWDRSESEIIGDVKGYVVKLMTQDPYSVSQTDVGMNNTATCDTVKARPGRNTATVAAYNEQGQSDDSNVVRWRIVTDPPEPPTNVRSEGTKMDDCMLYWDPSPDEANGTVQEYFTTISQLRAMDLRGVSVGLVNEVPCKNIGAQTGQNVVKVRASNPAGLSEYSEAHEFYIEEDGETPPPCEPCKPCTPCELRVSE